MVEHAVPILPSHNLRETLAFYERLGFTNLGTPPEEWDYLILGRGDVMLHFIAAPDVDPLSTASSCYLYVDDVDGVHEQWRSVGIGASPGDGGARLEPPLDTEYGMREMAVVDPSGNLLRVGSELTTPR